MLKIYMHTNKQQSKSRMKINLELNQSSMTVSRSLALPSCAQNKSFQLTFGFSFFLIIYFLNWITMDGSLQWWSRNEGNARNEQIELLWDFFYSNLIMLLLPFHSSMLTSILHKWIYEFYIAVYYTTAAEEEEGSEWH